MRKDVRVYDMRVSVPDIREVTCVARRIRSEYAGAVFLEGPIKHECASGG